MDFLHEPPAPDDIQSIIAIHRDSGSLPDLNGVRVHIVGPSAGAYEDALSADSMTRIRNFWLAYLSAAGADASADRWGLAF